LLPFLKAQDDATRRQHAAALHETLTLVADAQQERRRAPSGTPCRRSPGWRPAARWARLYVKQLFGLINLQLRRLAAGHGSLPEAMLRDALFLSPPPPTDAGGAAAAHGVRARWHGACRRGNAALWPGRSGSLHGARAALAQASAAGAAWRRRISIHAQRGFEPPCRTWRRSAMC
jgi:chemosensory pili system protein ChpA (sensor histidine kinase/response regulator)